MILLALISYYLATTFYSFYWLYVIAVYEDDYYKMIDRTKSVWGAAILAVLIGWIGWPIALIAYKEVQARRLRMRTRQAAWGQQHRRSQ